MESDSLLIPKHLSTSSTSSGSSDSSSYFIGPDKRKAVKKRSLRKISLVNHKVNRGGLVRRQGIKKRSSSKQRVGSVEYSSQAESSVIKLNSW